MRANVRVIAATHQNLEERVRQGAFREDLFHRLNVIRLRLPALRERREDIPSLTRFFLQKSARELGVDAKRITDLALVPLAEFDFPGNVRQLENICHWLTVMAPAQVIEPKDLPPELLQAAPRAQPVASPPSPAPSPVAAPVSVVVMADANGQLAPDWCDGLERKARALLLAGDADVWDQLTHEFETRLIRTALDVTRGRCIEAAQKLGIGRNTITRKIQELDLKS